MQLVFWGLQVCVYICIVLDLCTGLGPMRGVAPVQFWQAMLFSPMYVHVFVPRDYSYWSAMVRSCVVHVYQLFVKLVVSVPQISWQLCIPHIFVFAEVVRATFVGGERWCGTINAGKS